MSLSIWLRQYFCNHIFKETHQEKLYKIREPYGFSWSGIRTYVTYDYWVSHRICLKCDKTKMIKSRSLLL